MQNVDLAIEKWAYEFRGKGDQWKALMWMALRSWDVGSEQNGDPPRRYWGGHPLLAFGMGITQQRKSLLTKSQSERVRRAVRDLAKAHAITVIEEGKGQQHAVYELRLELPSTAPLNLSGSP